MTEEDKKILLAEIHKLTLPAQEILKNLIGTEKPALRVEVIDDTHQKFNGEIYTRREKNGYYYLTKILHTEIWKYYNGLNEIPKGYLIHHDGRDENGNFTKEKNDIEFLKLMTREEHTALHNPLELNRTQDFICRNCGRTYQAKYMGKNCYCSKECRREWNLKEKHSGKFDEIRICKWCGKEFSTWKHSSQKYCSKHCAKLSQWAQIKSRKNAN